MENQSLDSNPQQKGRWVGHWSNYFKFLSFEVVGLESTSRECGRGDAGVGSAGVLWEQNYRKQAHLPTLCHLHNGHRTGDGCAEARLQPRQGTPELTLGQGFGAVTNSVAKLRSRVAF